MIYEKRQFQEGVTFYTDSFNGKVYDVDIDQNVTELHLSGNGEHNYVIKEILMLGNEKRFPKIERIYIGKNVTLIRILNRMFPNVKEIVSDSRYFPSGNLLIRKDSCYGGGMCLYNTFCKKSGELIDLKGVVTIAEEAFNGCESSNIVNVDEIKSIPGNAFHGYEKISELPSVDGAHMLGNIVMDYVSVIPKQARLFNREIDFTGKSITVYDISIVKGINKKRMPAKIILDNNGTIDMNDVDSILQQEKISEIEISADNPYFTSHEGILYNSDMTILIRCPAGRTGKVVIPDGVKVVSENAFYNCAISEVVIPDSVIDVERKAFFCCYNLEKITFSKNMSRINSRTFAECSSLRNINIPGHIKTIGVSAF